MNVNETEIIKLENQLIEAIKASDVVALDKLLHNDLLFLAPNGQVITKAMDLASHQANEMIVEELTPTFEAIHCMNDTAVITLVYATKGKMLGQPIDGQYRYIRVWKKDNNELKIIAGSCMKL
jgi:ketosteroid isomerase-like protein